MVFLAWNPEAFVRDAVAYPLGLGAMPSTVHGPLPGSLLASALPGVGGWIAAAAVLAMAGVAMVRLRSGTPTPAQAAG